MRASKFCLLVMLDAFAWLLQSLIAVNKRLREKVRKLKRRPVDADAGMTENSKEQATRKKKARRRQQKQRRPRRKNRGRAAKKKREERHCACSSSSKLESRGPVNVPPEQLAVPAAFVLAAGVFF